jgi:hypothetical protein
MGLTTYWMSERKHLPELPEEEPLCRESVRHFWRTQAFPQLCFPDKLSALAVLSLANQLLNLVGSSTRRDSQNQRWVEGDEKHNP